MYIKRIFKITDLSPDRIEPEKWLKRFLFFNKLQTIFFFNVYKRTLQAIVVPLQI